MTPGATITNLTATGDLVVGPGAPTNLIKALPVACVGDAVAGPLCVSGVITVSTAPTVISKGRPQANLGSVVMGVSPIGIPVATAVAVCPLGMTNIV
jgi:uncharacterized Zn-binding protein involved in type VI secretion